MVNWKDILIRLAKMNNICGVGEATLRRCRDKYDAVAFYKKHADWALERNFPDIDTLRREFRGFEPEGIFIDKQFRGESVSCYDMCVLHHCSGKITVDLNVDEAIIPMIYVANNCDITIERGNETDTDITVPVYTFGENILKCKNDEFTTFRVYNFELL